MSNVFGTFWHTYIPGESNFDTARLYPRLAKLIYGIGVLPTLLIILGAATCLWRNRTLGLSTLSDDLWAQRLKEKTLFLTFVFSVVLVLMAGLKLDGWSSFHARYFFPNILAILLFLGWGLEAVARWRAWMHSVLLGGLAVLYVILTGYFVIEITALLRSDWVMFDHKRGPGVNK